jgi:hypothetical protein
MALGIIIHLFYFTISLREGRKKPFLATDELNFNFYCSLFGFPLLRTKEKGGASRKRGFFVVDSRYHLHTLHSFLKLALTNQQPAPLLLTARGPRLSILANDAERPQLKFISLWLAHALTDHNNKHDENGQKHEDTTNCHSNHCTVTH